MKVRISYVTQRNNTFLFLFDLFSEFTSELRSFVKEVTLISFFLFFFFILFSEFTNQCLQWCLREWISMPRWKFVSKPIVL